MLIWDDALTYMQRQAQDTSDTALTFLKSMYNVAYKKILVEFGRQVTERTSTTSLVAAQRSYTVPPDCLFPKGLEMVDGTTRYPLVEVASDKKWAYMKSGNIQGRPTHYHYKPRFGIAGGVLELYPIPSSSNYTVDMVYEAGDRDLSQASYTTGTVTLTHNSAAVVGTTTVFTAAMVGRYLIPNDATADTSAYRISAYTDATHVTLETVYAGNTTSSPINYKIVEIPNLPEDMHILPCYFALQEWWSSKGNVAKVTEFETKFTQGMIVAKKTHSVVTRDSVVGAESPFLPFEPYPFNYPTSIS